MQIREMVIADYDAVFELLTRTAGMRLREVDSREATTRYLQRNPGLSFVACIDDRVVGCVMCGHDGRRGYLQHLSVANEFRRNGIGSELVESCLAKLEGLGILKTHIDVLTSNETGMAFWRKIGWKKREDIFRFSVIRSNLENV